METTVLKGFALGLSTGVYCMGACVPVVLPYLVSSGGSVRVAGLAVVQLAAGRLVAYLLLGLLAGVLGTQVQTMPSMMWLVAATMITLAILMLFYSITQNFPESRTCARISRWAVIRRFPFVAGLLLGVNFCPPVLLCVATIISVKSVTTGLLLAMSFFLGSTVFLLPLVFTGLLARWETIKGIASVAMLFCGLWFMVRGITLLFI